MRQADIIIIGGGPGGYETAAEAAARGKKVILFERDRLGGTCLNRGCIPTKCLCATAKRLHDIRTATTLGISTADATVDYSAVRGRIAEVTATLREGIEGILGNVEVIKAEARLAAGPAVEADGESYTAPAIIIATGSAPAALKVPGAETALDSDGVLALEAVPESMVIIGGGVIGLEFASVFAGFGCTVTVLEYCAEVLPGFDRDIAKRLRSSLGRRGIDIVTGAEVTAIDGGRSVTYLRKGKEKTVDAACVVAAVGRRPVVPGGLDTLGIECDRRGYIACDSRYETNIAGIYAIGDVNGRCMLAHAASAQGRVVLGQELDMDVMPAVVFTDPECASVGLTSEQAADSDREYTVVRLPYGANGKALASGEADGVLKLIVEKDSGLIAGCHCVGAHAADIIAEAAVAMNGSLTAHELAVRCIHAHPTISELLSTAALSCYREV